MGQNNLHPKKPREGEMGNCLQDAQLVTELPRHAAKQQKLQGVHSRFLQVCHCEQDVRHSPWKEKEEEEEEKLAGEEVRSRGERKTRGGEGAKHFYKL
jgi:hypothetical protein